MNNLNLGMLIPIRALNNNSILHPRLRISQLFTFMLSVNRHFANSPVVRTRRGQGGDVGRLSQRELVKMVENEERGIFRTLDIGLPNLFNLPRKKSNDRIVVKAAPRCVILP